MKSRRNAARLVAPRRADRLLHGGELALENPGAGQLRGVLQEAWPSPARASSFSPTNCS